MILRSIFIYITSLFVNNYFKTYQKYCLYRNSMIIGLNISELFILIMNKMEIKLTNILISSMTSIMVGEAFVETIKRVIVS